MRRPVADPRLAVSLRRLRARFGAGSPHVAVRTRLSVRARALLALAGVALLAGVAAASYWLGRQSRDDGQHISPAELVQLRQVLEALRAQAQAAEGKLKLERVAQEQLGAQLRAIEGENGRLKQELAFFDGLSGGEGAGPRLAIHRFRVEQEARPGAFRYRMLLGVQGDRRGSEFRGALQFVVTGRRPGGEDAKIVLPGAKDPDRDRYNLSFRHFRRVDGMITVPPDIRPTQVEVRILQDGQTQAVQSVAIQGGGDAVQETR